MLNNDIPLLSPPAPAGRVTNRRCVQRNLAQVGHQAPCVAGWVARVVDAEPEAAAA